MHYQQSNSYKILEKRVPGFLLKGYITDVSDEAQGLFYAYTFNELRPEDHEIASTLSLSINDGNSSWGADQEKSRIYVDDGQAYMMKGAELCIKEGVYYAYAVKFYGCLYEGWWYIMKELSYFGEHMPENQAHGMLTAHGNIASILNNDIYQPMESYYDMHMPGGERLSRGPEFQEFVGQPLLVAYIKQEQKLALCKAFTHFMNVDVFLPFTERIRVARYEEFAAFVPLYSNDFTMIFPKTREFILIPALVKNIQSIFRTCYFFWHAESRKMYEWTYFKPETSGSSHHYSFTIIKNLSGISGWNDYSYLNSSCTLDDKNFWDTYVLLKAEDGQYCYLNELPDLQQK